jgi:hypothetical protein
MGEVSNDQIDETEINNLLGQVQTDKRLKNGQLSSMLSNISEDRVKDSNFLHLQVSTQEMLTKLEHFYRGDFLKNVDGNLIWAKQKNKDLITFNDYGVTSLMEIITKYIDRNTILSNYPEERIYEILGDIGDELVLFILCNYIKIGMNTYFKKTKFRIIIVTTLHIIESTYRRALRGKTLEEINQAKVVGQFGESYQSQNFNSSPGKAEGWIKRQFSR